MAGTLTCLLHIALGVSNPVLFLCRCCHCSTELSSSSTCSCPRSQSGSSLQIRLKCPQPAPSRTAFAGNTRICVVKSLNNCRPTDFTCNWSVFAEMSSYLYNPDRHQKLEFKTWQLYLCQGQLNWFICPILVSHFLLRYTVRYFSWFFAFQQMEILSFNQLWYPSKNLALKAVCLSHTPPHCTESAHGCFFSIAISVSPCLMFL